jgi:hypothetical protein
MKTVVIHITADPRHSGRAAEGMRVADGLSHGEELAVSVLVDGAAAEAFARPEREWIDESLLLKHLVALHLRHIPAKLVAVNGAAPDPHLVLEAATKVEAEMLCAGAAAVIEF